MNQVKKEKITDKDSFFNILNKAISSPTTLQKQIESDNYSDEKKVHQHTPLDTSQKLSGKFHE